MPDNVEAQEFCERWPGYAQQSWSQRFAELDRRYSGLLRDASQRLAAALPSPDPAAIRAEERRVLRALLMVAPGFQGGHSDKGMEIADALGLPFPLSMETLRPAAIKGGFMPYDLWPWLKSMDEGRAAIRALSTDQEQGA